jgi:hypothetical protein
VSETSLYTSLNRAKLVFLLLDKPAEVDASSSYQFKPFLSSLNWDEAVGRSLTMEEDNKLLLSFLDFNLDLPIFWTTFI